MSDIDLEAIRRSYENWTVGLAVCPQPHGPCITCQPRANDAARHIPALLALVDELRAELDERDAEEIDRAFAEDDLAAGEAP